MADFYLDSSAIFKHYHYEPGSDVVDALFETESAHAIYTSIFTILEVRATATRLNRGGRIANRALRVLRDRLLVETGTRLRLVALTDVLMDVSQDLAETYGLTAGDAVQLGSALETASSSRVRVLTFVSADRQLNEAALKAGLNVLDPTAG